MSDTLHLWDWLVILAVVVGTLLPALLLSRRGGKDVDSYFVSGRSLPWWLAGTSIVATTFACDTPLAVTEGIRLRGVYENWYWWCIAGGHMLGVVMLARLWRRSRLVTDLSLIELRYDGRAAGALQVFRAGYFGLVYNMVVIGWVTRAMLSIFSAATGLTLAGANASVTIGDITLTGVAVHAGTVALLMGLSLLYSLFSGLWGVVVADLLQFGIAMAGAILLAVFAVDAAGGMDALMAHPAVTQGKHLALVPDLGAWEAGTAAFFVYVGLLWFTDRTADSGGYIAQRLLAAKNERHGTGAMLWFVIAHYALRPWPWVVAALASLVLLPDVPGIDAYPTLIMTVLPVGLRGLLVASLLAAFISTINTQFNWGASYLTRDVYMRLWRPRAQQRELVWVGRIVTVLLMVLGTVASCYTDSVLSAWKFLALLGAGTGLVLVGRWLWPRLNAWSEITVMAAALSAGLALKFLLPWMNARYGWQWAPFRASVPVFPLPFAFELPLVVAFSTAAWLLVTRLTAPTSREKLRAFYARIRPPGPLWAGIARECGLQQPRGLLRRIALAWALGVAFVFLGLFGIGHLVLQRPRWAAVELALCAAAGVAFFLANAAVGRRMPPPVEPAEPAACVEGEPLPYASATAEAGSGSR